MINICPYKQNRFIWIFILAQVLLKYKCPVTSTKNKKIKVHLLFWHASCSVISERSGRYGKNNFSITW